MKIKDLTDDANSTTVEENESWMDYVDWKGLRAKGYQKVMINGQLYDYNKWGIINN